MRTPLLFSRLPRVRDVDWLHLNWPERMYGSNSPEVQATKFRRMMVILSKMKDNGTRLLWTLHNIVPHDASDKQPHHNANANLLDLCDLVHVHSQAASDYLVHDYGITPEKIHLMPHGHYATYYGSAVSRVQARQVFGIPQDAILLLAFGNWRRYKGVEQALAAFHECRRRNLYFMVAGKPADAAMRKYLEQENKQDSRLIMRLSEIRRKHVATIFSAADAFIFPSSNFLTSGSVMLALTYELPIIAIPKNHLSYFQGKTFFNAWLPADRQTLTSIMYNLETWLPTVDHDELREVKKEFDWKTLTVGLSKRLKVSV